MECKISGNKTLGNQPILIVTPAEAGVQAFLDTGLRRYDGSLMDFWNYLSGDDSKTLCHFPLYPAIPVDIRRFMLFVFVTGHDE